MAQAVIDTEAGRAMLINAAMMQAADGMALPFSDSRFFALMTERWPHYVHYRGRGKPVHCPPDTYGFIGPSGPSHCDWMVPGTHG